jgi:SWI/SNF-related matrix-associated actin-dependent regulator of chromatin subfamily A3
MGLLAQSFYTFQVSQYGACYGLYSSGNVCAFLNKKICTEIKELHAAMGPDALRFEAYAQSDHWNPAFESYDVIRSPIVTVDLNIYGSRENAHQLGKLLAKYGISLQQPLFGLAGYNYYNPHFLHVPEFLGETMRPLYLLSRQ